MKLNKQQVNQWLTILQENINLLYDNEEEITKQELREEINYNITLLKQQRRSKNEN